MLQTLFGIGKKGETLFWSVDTEGCEVVVTHGKFGGKLQTKRTVCESKNVGKLNETTPEDQAVFEANSKYSKQLDRCYRATVEEARNVDEVLPMLAQNYLDRSHNICFPCHVSPKLDGVRCLANISNGTVTLNSRGGKTYPCPDHIRDNLLSISSKTGICKFDGELYIHGLSLQNIVSCVKKPNSDTENLVYHIYDIPSKKVWSERYADLELVRKHMVEGSTSFVGCILTNSRSSAEILLNKFIGDGYEGLMLRNLNGLYEFNNRSSDLQKWKLMQDLEALVIGVESDKNGEGVLICKMINSDLEFRCKMRGGHDYRAYENQLTLVGKWITVKYQALTDGGLPQFPVGVSVRECDINGTPLE